MRIFRPPNIEKMKARKNVKGLIKVLDNNNDINLRSDAADALGEIGDPWAIVPLIASLDDAWLLKPAAINALGKIGDTRAVEPLIGYLWDDLVGNIAADALGEIGDSRAVKPLIVALRSGSEHVQESSARALGRIGDAQAVEPLIAALRKSDAVRNAASEALKKLGWSADESEAGVRYWVAKHNWKKAGEYGALAVEPLIVALKDGDEKTCKGAAKALVKVGKPAVAPLIKALKNDELNDFPLVFQILGKIGEPAVKPLINALRNKKLVGKRWAIPEVLGKIGDKRAVESLISALKEEDMREEAAAALIKLGWTPDKGEAGAWYWFAQNDWDALIPLGEAAIDPLIVTLRDHDKDRRKRAARSLIKIYQKATLDEQSKKRILSVRKTIIQSHNDSESCFGHTDTGIGINFPL